MNIEIGTRISYEDMANPYREGVVVDIKENSNSYVLGSNGIESSTKQITVIYEDLHRSTFPASFLTSPGGHRIVDKPKATLQEVEELKAKFMAKRKEDLERHQCERNEKEQKIEEGRKFIESKRPSWAKAVIVGVEEIDNSDLTTDYFSTKQGQVILLAWSKHTKDLFPEMRKAAKNAPQTEHLVAEDRKLEHREKWSMGAGYYLKKGNRYSTGWKVEKWPLAGMRLKDIYLATYCIPEKNNGQHTVDHTANPAVTIGNYKGHPVISLPNGDKPFTFGLAKAKTIVKYIEDIKKFIEDNEKR